MAPYLCNDEISRHFYTKNGVPLMMVCKLAGGGEERFYFFKNSFEARWSDRKLPIFQHCHYNHDAIIQARLEPVLYVESEEEADQLVALGLLATTYGRPAAIPPFQKDVLRGRTILAIGRAGADGEVHVNAVKGEYQSVANVRIFRVEHPSGLTPPGYRLSDWLRDVEGEDRLQ